MEKRQCNSNPTPRDRLSSLSDELLHAILFRLPDATATCILSHRWLDVWATIPDLNIDERDFFQGIPEDDVPDELHKAFIKFVDRALISRKGDAALLSLRLSTPFEAEDSVNSWARYAIQHGVQVLEIEVVEESFSVPIRGPTFTQHSLQRLKIDCHYEFKWPESIRLPSLTHLFLRNCSFSTTTEKDVISKSCPRLHDLKMFVCSELDILEHVNYPLLKELELNSMDELEEIVVQCVNLRSLAVIDCFWSSDRRCLYLDAPNLNKFKLDVVPLFSCLFAKSSTFPSLEYACFNMLGMDKFETAGELTLQIEKSVDSIGFLLIKLANAKQLIINSSWDLMGLSYYLQKNISNYAEDFIFKIIQRINITYSPRTTLDALYFLIMSSPNLNALTITNHNTSDNIAKIKLDKIPKVEMGELRTRHSSSLGKLTEVKIKNFGGTKCEKDLLELVLSSANVLSKVIIQFPKNILHEERECFMKQIQKLHIVSFRCHVLIC